MRPWIAITSSVLLLACTEEAERSQGTVSVGEAKDGGGYLDGSLIPLPPARPPGSSSGGGRGGDGDGDGDGDGKAGTPFEELTERQLDALCDDVLEVFASELSRREMEELGCVFGAMLSIDYQELGGTLVGELLQCREAVADCLTAIGGTSRLLCETDDFRTAAMSCRGFAEDYVACAAATARAFGDAVDQLTCNNLAAASTVEDALEASTQLDAFAHDECRAIGARCPELFRGSTRGEPAEDGCDNTCEHADNGWCDDGDLDAVTSRCARGTDCVDCGRRPVD